MLRLLPVEILVYVLSFMLDVTDRVAVKRTCQAFGKAVKMEWMTLLRFYNISCADESMAESRATEYLAFMMPRMTEAHFVGEVGNKVALDVILKNDKQEVCYQEFKRCFSDDGKVLVKIMGHPNYPAYDPIGLLKDMARNIANKGGPNLDMGKMKLQKYICEFYAGQPRQLEGIPFHSVQTTEWRLDYNVLTSGVRWEGTSFPDRYAHLEMIRWFFPQIVTIPRTFPCELCFESCTREVMHKGYCLRCLNCVFFCPVCNEIKTKTICTIDSFTRGWMIHSCYGCLRNRKSIKGIDLCANVFEQQNALFIDTAREYKLSLLPSDLRKRLHPTEDEQKGKRRCP